MTTWHAVSVVPCDRPCRMIKQLTAVRWLSAMAPTFPVAGCDVSRCACRYKHHADRRGKPQRQIDGAGSLYRYAGVERRGTIRGRRSTDLLGHSTSF